MKTGHMGERRWTPSTGPFSGVESLRVRQRQVRVIVPDGSDGSCSLGGWGRAPSESGAPGGGAVREAGREAVVLGRDVRTRTTTRRGRRGGRARAGLASSKRPLPRPKGVALERRP